MKKYQHLFFDLDHTLWDFDKNAKTTLTKIYGHFGLDIKVKAAFDDFYAHLDKNFLPLSSSESDTLKKLFLRDYVTETSELTAVMTLLSVEEKDKPAVYATFEEKTGTPPSSTSTMFFVDT